MVWASPVCTEYSRALTTRPRRLLKGDALVLSALEIIAHFDPLMWVIENPATGLLYGLLVRSRPTSFDGSPNGSTPSAPPAAPARHQSPRQGRDSSYQGRDSDFALHRGRFSDFALASDFARKILRKRCGGERIASGVGFHPENPIAGPAPKVRQRCCPRSIADISPLTRPAVNPAVATGLLHPILLWQQDCSTQSCCGNRIAPAFPRKRWIARKTPPASCCVAMR